MCCAICDCLGYCSKRDNDKLRLSGSKVLSGRSFEECRLSFESGCGFCGLAVQASALLRSAGLNPLLEILLYPQAPTEIHSLSIDENYDVVEVYPSSGRRFRV